jgi:uncharacterized protein (DUF58 family)
VRPPPTTAGVRRARSRGTGVEFHEYRRYQGGDDPRYIDWTVEARLRQLVVRVSRADGHLRLHVLVDGSASMGLGNPTKLRCAQRVAAALCYIGAGQRDAVGLSAFRDRIESFMPPAPGKSQLFKTFDALERMSPSGPSNIELALEHYAAASRGPGLIVVLSDYFEPGAGLKGLQSLVHRRFTPAVVQIVSREEVIPDVATDTALVDVERSHAGQFVIDPTAVGAYRARLAEHDASLQMFCTTHGLTRARILSDMSFQQVLAALEDGGLLGMRT